MRSPVREPGWRTYAGATLAALLLGFSMLLLPNGISPDLDVLTQFIGFDIAFGIYYVPIAVLLGYRFPRQSWRWGLVLGWPLFVVSALFVGLAFSPWMTNGQARPTTTPAGAVLLMPAAFVPIPALAAWAAARVRSWINQQR